MSYFFLLPLLIDSSFFYLNLWLEWSFWFAQAWKLRDSQHVELFTAETTTVPGKQGWLVTQSFFDYYSLAFQHSLPPFLTPAQSPCVYYLGVSSVYVCFMMDEGRIKKRSEMLTLWKKPYQKALEPFPLFPLQLSHINKVHVFRKAQMRVSFTFFESRADTWPQQERTG